jgi:hypothetical protein
MVEPRFRFSLRTVITAALVGCSLPAALWVRSYQATDVVYGWFGVPGYFQINSSCGCLKLIVNCERQKLLWKYNSKPPEAVADAWDFNLYKNPKFGWWLNLTVPHYLALVLCGVFAAAVAILGQRIRFRVRTLLIAITLIAIVLGIMASA